MARFLLLGLLPAILSAEGHWVKYTSGPFEVITDAGSRVGRDTLVGFEEFRNAVGQIVGEQDLQTPHPVRIMVFRDPRGWTPAAPVSQGRDRYNIVLGEKGGVSPAVYADLTRLFLAANTGRMPAAFEHGLVEFFSTFQLHGIRNTVGAPPPSPDLDWARVDLLVVDPEYYGRIRVLLYNLRQGVDPAAAYSNAFGKTPAAIEAQAKQLLAGGNFPTSSISSRSLAPSDFPERPVSDTDARLARADLLAGSQSAAEYQGLIRDHLKVAEAQEGLGLLALAGHRTDEARRDFQAAIAAGSTSARCYIEYAKLEPDNEKATEALLKAAGINPKLDEPFALMAKRDTDPRKRLAHWKAAAERDPRNASYWQALAECYLAEHDFANAAKAWTSGEQAAADPAERARMRQARLAIEQQRLDYEAAEKQQQADADARDLAKLKEEARAHVRQLEAEYSEKPPAPPDKVVPWWNGPKPPGKVDGILERVDCLGRQARLSVKGDDGKVVRLLVNDPGKIAMIGPGELSLGCGAQKPRRVSIGYFPKRNARLGTAGEVATIEFQ
jgi:hypothetical protein